MFQGGGLDVGDAVANRVVDDGLLAHPGGICNSEFAMKTEATEACKDMAARIFGTHYGTLKRKDLDHRQRRGLAS